MITEKIISITKTIVSSMEDWVYQQRASPMMRDHLALSQGQRRVQKATEKLQEEARNKQGGRNNVVNKRRSDGFSKLNMEADITEEWRPHMEEAVDAFIANVNKGIPAHWADMTSEEIFSAGFKASLDYAVKCANAEFKKMTGA